MTILANVALTDTFDIWRIRTNQIIMSLNTIDANSTNANTLANSAYSIASLAFDKANSGYNIVIPAFDATNSVYGLSNTTSNTLILAFTTANTAYNKANAANVLAYTTSLIAPASYDKANDANILAYTTSIITTSAFNQANTVYNKANSANYYAYLVDANTTAAFAKANSANYYAYLVNSNTVAAFSKANSALANSTTTLAGDFTVTGNIKIGTSAVPSVNNRLYVQGSSGSSIETVTDNTSIVLDMTSNNNFSITLGGSNTFINPTIMTPGQSGVIWITQDSTGSRVPSWGSYWKFPGNTAPTLTATASAVDAIVYIVRTSTSITAQAILNVG